MIIELVNKMSSDMNISRFQDESDEQFIYRIIYSALGQWCLSICNNITGTKKGATKHYLTKTLHNLLDKYIELFPFISNKFIDTNNLNKNILVWIQKVYRETGYLIPEDEHYNKLADFERSIILGGQALYFGLPQKPYTVNGLGVFSSPSTYIVPLKEYLIRDDLTSEEYFNIKFDPIDFVFRNIDLSFLEFFNPLLNNVPSLSWSKSLETECTIARNIETGSYYRVIKTEEGFMFADEPVEEKSDSFNSYEYRRLYYALKAHYKNPLNARIVKIDREYSKLILEGHLPYREYFFLLLVAWPEKSAFDKTNFIIKNSLLYDVRTTLENIGIKIVGGFMYE